MLRVCYYMALAVGLAATVPTANLGTLLTRGTRLPQPRRLAPVHGESHTLSLHTRPDPDTRELAFSRSPILHASRAAVSRVWPVPRRPHHVAHPCRSR
jgi:hypothetical protein